VKTGGLGEVTGALWKEYRRINEDAYIILPLYEAVKKRRPPPRDTGVGITVPVGDRLIAGRIFTDRSSTYFIECDEFFGRAELYGTPEGDYADNASRFIFFSRGILETCKALNMEPDIIHCNDWQTALVPLYLKTIYSTDKFFKKAATVLTIHNLGYQGLFGASEMPLTNLGWELFNPEGIEFYGGVNFLKAGIISADILTTVSKTYAKEILNEDFGFGLEGLLRLREEDLYGVRNGIDYEEWDPSTDEFIPASYSPDDISGRTRCKKELIRSLFGPPEKFGAGDIPLVSMVGRLSAQKGLQLVFDSVDELLSFGVKLVILGKGDDLFQRRFSEIAKKYKGMVSVTVGFDEALAHRIYAGSDFFLMPSRYEPCGLGQLIALRYGCVPIARKTGGSADTIQDYEDLFLRGTGFLFSDYTPSAMQDAVKRALCVYTDRDKMRKMISDGMKIDFSWQEPAAKYIELYRAAIKKKRS
jgi:starch synthase